MKLASSLPLVFWYLQGSLTLLVAFFAAYIAVRQWKTNAGRVKLDLFDRRFRVFTQVREILSVVLRDGDVKLDNFQRFRSETFEAQLLFRSEIMEYINEINSHLLTLSTAKEHLRGAWEGAAGIDRKTEAETIQNELKWLLNQFNAFPQKFKVYLDFSKL
jgi:hypothetical protein